ncbi:unnamed protein product [Haemonchus placei]|uniref:Ig-like domain-containing protein n=1 Tax=Haemonchus placei TaxID=6290 RepID=A0A0N4WCB0_HAEPC|nr:unnamed protein product [Haemonchus placei]
MTSLSHGESRDGSRTRWFLNGAVISGAEAGVELSQNNRHLTLMVPDALDNDRNEHELECKVDAASGVLFDQKSLKIRIVEEPILKPSQAEKLSPLGSRLAIPCSPRKLSVVPLRIQWYFNGSEVLLLCFTRSFFVIIKSMCLYFDGCKILFRQLRDCVFQSERYNTCLDSTFC